MLLLATACAVSPPIIASRTSCVGLVPQHWRDGVSGATPPARVDPADHVALATAWMEFGLAQTGQLAKANERLPDALGIIERCEERDRQSIEAARPKFLGVF